MKKMRKIVSVMVMVFVVASLGGFSFKAQAATNSDSCLPKGWTSFGINNLSDEQKKDLPNKALPGGGTLPGENIHVSSSKLTSLNIIDLALDERNEVHIVTQEIGLSLDDYRYVWLDGKLCNENVAERQPLVNSNGDTYGNIRYFHTGIIYSSNLKGKVLNVKAQAVSVDILNVLKTERQFILP